MTANNSAVLQAELPQPRIIPSQPMRRRDAPLDWAMLALRCNNVSSRGYTETRHAERPLDPAAQLMVRRRCQQAQSQPCTEHSPTPHSVNSSVPTQSHRSEEHTSELQSRQYLV